MAKRKVSFSLKAPNAEVVLLAGDFTGWEQDARTLTKQKNGVWKTTLTLESGRYQYRYLVDGNWQDDPACEERMPNQFGGMNCVRIVA